MASDRSKISFSALTFVGAVLYIKTAPNSYSNQHYKNVLDFYKYFSISCCSLFASGIGTRLRRTAERSLTTL